MADIATPGANAFLNGTSLPATLYVQFHVGNPGTNGTANLAALTTRQSFTRGTSTTGTCNNAALIQWINAPNNEVITHVSIWDAASSGICWFIDDIADTTVFPGDTISIFIHTLVLTLSVWT